MPVKSVRQINMPLTAMQKQQVKQIVAVKKEVKFFPTGQTAIPFDDNGVIFTLNLVPQALNDQGRVGDTIYPVLLEFRYYAYIPTSGANCRFIIFQWHANTVPVPSNLLLIVGSAIAAVSGLTVDVKPLYKILYDSVFPLYQGGSGVSKHLEIPLKGAMQYQGGSSTVSTNAIYLLVISNQATVTPEMDFFSNLHYTDS